MANLPESATWETGIYQLEETDPVQGGPNGIDNQQGKQLANRTTYLKEQVESLGTGKQPLDATLSAIAALVGIADRIIYFNGPDTVAMTPLTAFIRTLLDDADASTARATLGAISQAQLDAAIAALVNSSPATLDTLKELATALGNDANFATTMTNALALKASIQSIQKSESIVSAAGGTADAITGSYTPGITALTNGMTLYVRAASANATTTPTFTPNSGSIAAKTIVKGNGQALVAGDVAGGGHWIELQYDLTLDKWVLLNPSSGITTKGVERFTSNGSFTVPAGVSTIYVSGCAGGGGGGGSMNATSSVSGGSGGGGAGASTVRQAFSVTPGQSISITIGGAGSGGVQGNGTAGGNTVVGSLVTLPGGGGGVGGGAGTNSSGGIGGSGYPNGSHGNDVNSGASSIGTGNGGAGASCPFGGGGGAGRSGTNGGLVGNAAYGFGSGGGGGAGAPGFVIIEW